MMAIDLPGAEPTALAVIDGEDTVVCLGAGAIELGVGERIDETSPFGTLVRRARMSASTEVATVALAAGRTWVRATPMRCVESDPWVVLDVASPADAVLARARAVVEAASRQLEECRDEARRLQRLSEALLETGPPTVVVDAYHRVQGWSTGAEEIWDVPARRAVGRRLTSFSAALDPDALRSGRPVRTDTPRGQMSAAAVPVDDTAHLVVVFERVAD